MIALKRKLQQRIAHEAGFSLIEVLVALMVFSVLSVAIAYALTQALVLTNEARAREVAIHLASQEVDKIRSLEDIFQVVANSSIYTVNGTDFTVTRKPVWDNSAGDAIQCGDLAGGSGSFEFKRVEIEIDWQGRRAGSSKVYTDTIIAPNRRITDPALGTILISVINAAGGGASGIAVSATPNGGGATTPPETIPVTDSEGCSYVLKVTPGQYILKASKSGYVDVTQSLNETSSTITVGAGELKSVQFQFDAAANFNIKFADNYTLPVVLPDSAPVTAVSTYGIFNLTGSALPLHPFSSGYQFLAGIYKAPAGVNNGCLSPDAGQWADAAPVPPSTDALVGQRGPIYTATPGGSVIAPVEMGVLKISLNGNRMIRAVSVATSPGTGDPGCELGYTVTYPNRSGAVDIALPFGTWQIQTKQTSGGSWGTIKATTSDKLLSVQTLGTIVGDKVLIDPRKVP